MLWQIRLCQLYVFKQHNEYILLKKRGLSGSSILPLYNTTAGDVFSSLGTLYISRHLQKVNVKFKSGCYRDAHSFLTHQNKNGFSTASKRGTFYFSGGSTLSQAASSLMWPWAKWERSQCSYHRWIMSRTVGWDYSWKHNSVYPCLCFPPLGLGSYKTKGWNSFFFFLNGFCSS